MPPDEEVIDSKSSENRSAMGMRSTFKKFNTWWPIVGYYHWSHARASHLGKSSISNSILIDFTFLVIVTNITTTIIFLVSISLQQQDPQHQKQRWTFPNVPPWSPTLHRSCPGGSKTLQTTCDVLHVIIFDMINIIYVQNIPLIHMFNSTHLRLHPNIVVNIAWDLVHRRVDLTIDMHREGQSDQALLKTWHCRKGWRQTWNLSRPSRPAVV